ncbi:hypothetical protein [Flavobacterium sp.]|uniref:hypothetical protein n=1 Tax=Flavobacterium sp. TaxID=239 RepID=UPI004047270F
MKLKFTILFISIYAFSFSQKNDVSFKDLGLHKKVIKVESMTYSMEDKMVYDTSNDIFNFDDNGAILYHEFNIYGKYESSTYEHSKYENNKLIQRDVTVKNRPNFTSFLTCKYDSNNNLKQQTQQAKYYNNDFFYTYDKKDRLIEIKGVYKNSYSIEKFYYENEKLYKTIIQYFKQDTVSSENIKLYIQEEVVVEYDVNDKFSKAYLNDENAKLLIQLNYSDPLLNIEEIESKIIKEQFSAKMLKDYLLNDDNKPFVKIIVNERFKNNEHNDWIAKVGVDKMHREEQIYYTFRKITYADGIESGSTDFDIFLVNELKTMLNKK